MAITRERIFEVAEAMDAAGQVPTLAAVRKAIGGGIFTTISEAMTEWKANKAAKETPLREPAPPALFAGVLDLVGFWRPWLSAALWYWRNRPLG